MLALTEGWAVLIPVAFTILCLTIALTKLRKEVHHMALDFSKLQTAASNAVEALKGEAARQKAAVDSAVAVAVDAAVAAERVAHEAALSTHQDTMDAVADSLAAASVPAVSA